jgi:hypothetical protein
VAMAKNHTFINLLDNPNATYIIIELCTDSSNAVKTNMEPGSLVMTEREFGFI